MSLVPPLREIICSFMKCINQVTPQIFRILIITIGTYPIEERENFVGKFFKKERNSEKTFKLTAERGKKRKIFINIYNNYHEDQQMVD